MTTIPAKPKRKRKNGGRANEDRTTKLLYKKYKVHTPKSGMLKSTNIS